MKQLWIAGTAALALSVAANAQAATTFTIDFAPATTTCSTVSGNCSDGFRIASVSGLPAWMDSVGFDGSARYWSAGYVGATHVLYASSTTASTTITFNASSSNKIRVASFVIAPWGPLPRRGFGAEANGNAVTTSPLSTATGYTASGGFASSTTFVFSADAFYNGLDSITLELQSAPGGPGVVPEPSTWMLMILGFGLIAQQLRRRHMAAA